VTTPAPIAWTDPARERAFFAWLAGLPAALRLDPATLRPASADASFRRYLRLDGAQGSRIVMDAPPAHEDCRPFVRVAGLLHEGGLHAPEVLAWDEAQGFMLLTDLGDTTYLRALDGRGPAEAAPLYLAALDALVALQRIDARTQVPAYDRALLEREMRLFPDWYIARHRGIAVEGPLKERLERSFKAIVENNLAAAPVYVHRDFMPRNLMVGDDRGLGVLDFQDAVYGPVTYDIASLMRDAFLSWDEEFVLDVTVRYWERARKAGLPVDPDFGAFYRAVEWMGLQRHLKVAGIFARLTLRDGKPKYLADTPRFIAYIRATAGRYRELTPLLRVIDEIEGTQAQTGFAYGRM